MHITTGGKLVTLSLQQQATLQTRYQALMRHQHPARRPTFEAWLTQQLADGMLLPHTPEHDAFVQKQMNS